MAQILGESGAWANVCHQLKQINFHPKELSDIENFLNSEKAKLASEEAATEQQLQEEKSRFSKQIAHLDEQYQKAVSTLKEKFSKQIKTKILRIKQLREPTSFFKMLWRKWEIVLEKIDLWMIHREQIKKLKKIMHKKASYQTRFERAHQKNQHSIKNKIKFTKYNIQVLEHTQTSTDFLGAIAEKKLIKRLSSLPDDFYVLNDVHLSLHRGMLFDGQWRRTAQIDTLVISPAGIFVVEVKNWSKEFVNTNDYHNPYDQVKWAAYLCYKHTQIKTRAIIAHTGQIPEKDSESYAKVLHLNAVKDYILWFKDKSLTQEQTAYWAQKLYAQAEQNQ